MANHYLYCNTSFRFHLFLVMKNIYMTQQQLIDYRLQRFIIFTIVYHPLLLLLLLYNTKHKIHLWNNNNLKILPDKNLCFEFPIITHNLMIELYEKNSKHRRYDDYEKIYKKPPQKNWMNIFVDFLTPTKKVHPIKTIM